MNILISGAGVAGLALAGFLRNHDVKVDIIDRSKGFSHLGYAIFIWPIGARILNKLELSKQIAQKGMSIKKMIALDSQGSTLMDLDVKGMREQYGELYTLTRENLHTALRSLVDTDLISFNTTVETIREQKDSVLATFNNGKKKKYDLVVSSDGVWSKIREMIFDVLPSNYKFSVWISWLKKNPKLPKNPRFIIGTDAYIIFIPSKGGRHVAYFVVKVEPGQPDPELHRIERLKIVYKNFESLGKEIIKSIDDEPSHIYHDDMRKVNLDDWYRGRVVLTGDAEHAMSPVTGMGSSLALEDAFVLYDELLAISFKSENVEVALKRFAERRQPRVQEIEKFSDFLMGLAIDNKAFALMRNEVFKTSAASQWLNKAIKSVFDRMI